MFNKSRGTAAVKHDVTLILIPSQDQDAISGMLRFREAMRKDVRKYLVGPVVADNKYRMFVMFPDGVDDTVLGACRESFIKYAHTIPGSAVLHVQFGDGATTVIHSTDPVTISEEIKNQYVEKMRDMEYSLQLMRKEVDEAIRLRNKDEVLSLAVAELKKLKGKGDILKAAERIAKECQNSDEPAVRHLINLIGASTPLMV